MNNLVEFIGRTLAAIGILLILTAELVFWVLLILNIFSIINIAWMVLWIPLIIVSAGFISLLVGVFMVVGVTKNQHIITQIEESFKK